MADSLKDYAMKGVALLILLFAGFILFKIVVGTISAIVWTLAGIAALIAVVWALSRLL